MNFGSKKVYVYNRSDSESLSDDSGDEAERTRQRRQQNPSGWTTDSAPRYDSAGPRYYDDDSDDMDQMDCNIEQAGNVVQTAHTSMAKAPKHKKRSIFARMGRALSGKKSRSHRGGRQKGSDYMQTDSIGQRSFPPVPAPRQTAQSTQPQRRRERARRADANVFTCNVGTLVQARDYLHTNSKRVTCQTCHAVVTSLSAFTAAVGAGVSNLTCDFCNQFTRNVDVTDWRKPSGNDVTFELEAPPVSVAGQNNEDNYNVVFVFDISGSMGNTTETTHRDPQTGRMRRTYVSRLDAVKKAALHQIKQIKDESPNVRVGFVAFGTEIFAYGDTTHPMKKFSEREVRNIEQLKVMATDVYPLKPIKDTYDQLTTVLSGIGVNGMTALGPALMASVSMAGNIAGSKVILCTDGQANVGVGSLPNDNAGEQELSDCRVTYRSFGNFAKDKGVSVSVISLEGTDCRLIHLGLVAEMTGGVVDIVSLDNLDTQFGNILTSRTVATDVSVRFVLHHSLYIRTDASAEQTSTRFEHIGNVDADTDMIIEFGVKTQANENENPVDIAQEDEPQIDAHVYGSESGPRPPSQPSQPLDDELQTDAEVFGTESGPNPSQPPLDDLPPADPPKADALAANQLNIPVESDQLQMDAEVHSSPGPVPSQPTTLASTSGPAAGTTPDVSSLPFQVQVSYTSRDGGKYLRVVTNHQDTTTERAEAEMDIDMDVVGAATSKTVSKVALAGDVKSAQTNIKTKKKMAARVMNMKQMKSKGKRSVKLSADSPADAADGDSDSDLEEIQEYQQDLDALKNLMKPKKPAVQHNSYLQTDSLQVDSWQSDSVNIPEVDSISPAGYSRAAVPLPQLPQTMLQQQHQMSDSVAREFYERGAKGQKAYVAKKAARKNM